MTSTSSAVLRVLVLSMVAAGCSFAVDVVPTPTAPKLQPSASAEIVRTRPRGHPVELGTINLQGNNYMDASDCDARLIIEARKLGGNVVFAQPEESGIGQGPRCRGVAYFVK